jgi:hypothetical protein
MRVAIDEARHEQAATGVLRGKAGIPLGERALLADPDDAIPFPDEGGVGNRVNISLRAVRAAGGGQANVSKDGQRRLRVDRAPKIFRSAGGVLGTTADVFVTPIRCSSHDNCARHRSASL